MTEIEIANLALNKIGSTNITALSDKSDVNLENVLDQSRDRLLKRFDWNFAKDRVLLYPYLYGLANALKIAMNAHAADAAEHATAADTVNYPVATADATTLTTLYALVGALLTAYDAHDTDAELGAAWAYHIAQETSDHSLASAVAPTTEAESLTKLTDLLSKYNAHDADSTCHTTGSLHQETPTMVEEPDFEYNYQFILPTDYLGHAKLYETESKHVIEGDKLLCDDEYIYLKYTKQVTDPTRFTNLFIECLVLDIAIEISTPITNDPKLKLALQQELLMKYLDNSLTEYSENNAEEDVEDTSWQEAGR